MPSNLDEREYEAFRAGLSWFIGPNAWGNSDGRMAVWDGLNERGDPRWFAWHPSFGDDITGDCREFLTEIAALRSLPSLEEWSDDPEPEASDAYIFGEYGGRYGASVDGTYLGKFDTDDEAMDAVREHCRRYNYNPNLWIQDDHGGLTIRNLE